jgi:hypothetical protein
VFEFEGTEAGVSFAEDIKKIDVLPECTDLQTIKLRGEISEIFIVW